MPSAEIITIGTELLLGEIVDTNSQYLAHSLRNVGIDLHRITTVGDNVNRIAEVIQASISPLRYHHNYRWSWSHG